MKKFIKLNLAFITPFMLLYLVNYFYYDKDQGDLIRLGYLYSNPCPKSLINQNYDQKIFYDTLSGLDLSKQHSFDILTIGDSFTEIKEIGYKNYLANDSLQLLHVDRFISGNKPNQKLIELANSSFFEKVHVKYVILQNVERSFNKRLKKLDFDKKQIISNLERKIRSQKNKQIDKKINFFSDALIKIPLTNILYNFKNKPLDSKTYKVQLDQDDLFTNNPDHFLFYQNDITKMSQKNNRLTTRKSVENLNKIGSKLAKKGIKLIVLVAPDKYDMYYDHILNKSKFPKPLFFKHYNGISKSYIDIPAYHILKKRMENQKNIYYYDDTHWSPKAAQYISYDIKKKIAKTDDLY